MVGACRQHGVDGDQVLHAGDLGRQDDAVARQADLFGEIRRQERRLHDGLARHLLGRQRKAVRLVLVHQPRQQFLVERAPVDADAHRLVVADRHFDDLGELLVLLVLEADIARVDAILGERFGAGRMIGEQLVADIVEVADERHVQTEALEPLADLRHGGGTLVAVDGDAHQFRAGLVKGGNLRHRSVDISCIGVGHRLDDHRRATAHYDPADIDGDGRTAGLRIKIEGGRHGGLLVPRSRQ
ncbi:hypothetical protein D9M70_381660 [compost metagenome]